MVKWPTPQNLKQLRGVLRLTGYYRRLCFYDDPVTELLKKMPQWTKDSQESLIV